MSRKSLTDAEQYLLQQFLNNSVLDQFNFKDLFRNILAKFNIKHNIENDKLKELIVKYLKSINEVIRNYSLEIKIGTCELTGITFYCLVRQYDSSSIGLLSQLYSQNELKLFKKILNLIIESDEGIIEINSIINCLFEDASIAKMTNKEIREIIDKFIADYWLILVTSSKIALHSRTIIELSQYFTEVYGTQSVINCQLCKEIVIVGVQCETCSIKLHRHCAKKYFQKSTDCPSCKNAFSNEQVSMLRDSGANTSKSGSSQLSTQAAASANTSQLNNQTFRDVKNVTLLQSQEPQSQVNSSQLNGTNTRKKKS